MRTLLCVALAVAVLLPVTAQEKPDDLVKAAVRAAGGSEVLAKYSAGRTAGKGTLFSAAANRSGSSDREARKISSSGFRLAATIQM